MATLTPLPSWRLRDNSAQWSKWDLGVVDAGTTSSDYGFLVWNNYKGSTDVPDMEDVSITTKDETGGTTGDLVTGLWIQVKNDSVTETEFKKVGFDPIANEVIKHNIKTTKSTTFTPSGSSTPVVSTPGDPNHKSVNGETCILGVANDGSKGAAGGNFIELTMNAFVPGTASAGLINFWTRVSYKYV
jgi:hypothetical protein